ncbi:MAG: transcriptional repressor [Actinomycetia bacterium]|nr:transcriptional repressor [Actinomycetes bacterium]MCP4224226.1 transcriptional repressor [Actinomycetes bacterium]MCP5031480.1 transcriptional repressor [Actinomycetes bacterium]
MQLPLLARLRDRKYRLTSQRRVVAEVLEGPNTHLTADEVHEAAIERLPEISRATVYSTLHELKDMGELRELTLDGRSKRYDPNVEPPHHHLVCDRCGRVFDVQHHLEPPALNVEEQHGMQIVSAEIVYHGTCADCSIG